MKYYFTTPIYYASGAPHLGHAYTTLVADCYRRYRSILGDEVMLVTGTDEHGQKIERAAAAAGIATRDFVDARSRQFRTLWQDLGIDVDRFERTTDAAHVALAQAFWRRLAANGDIVEGEYAGRYCVDCEQYFAGEAVCPVHGKPLETFAEQAWFFRLSRYQGALLAHIETHPDFILPVERRNEVLAFLRGNVLRDLCVSRSATRWGVPVPGDVDRVMYVWVDALASYLSALASTGETRIEDVGDNPLWRNATHFIGKDILTFHAVYWPALLMSAGLPLPVSIVVNGWLTTSGRKIAKSAPATAIDPRELTAVTGRDGLRWYFLKSVSLGHDLSFSRDSLVQTVNVDLANNLGNLFSRFTALAHRRLGPAWPCGAAPGATASVLSRAIAGAAQNMQAGFAAGNPALAAKAFIDAAAVLNAFFQQQAPWQIDDDGDLRTILGAVYHALCDLSVMGLPLLPDAMAQARLALGLDPRASWQEIGSPRATARVRETEPLFPRLADG